MFDWQIAYMTHMYIDILSGPSDIVLPFPHIDTLIRYGYHIQVNNKYYKYLPNFMAIFATVLKFGVLYPIKHFILYDKNYLINVDPYL